MAKLSKGKLLQFHNFSLNNEIFLTDYDLALLIGSIGLQAFYHERFPVIIHYPL